MDRWFPWLLGGQWLLAAAGTLSGIWFGIVFCAMTDSAGLTAVLASVWIVLAFSPLFGLLGIPFEFLRKPYAIMAVASPLMLGVLIVLNQSGITYCDGP